MHFHPSRAHFVNGTVLRINGSSEKQKTGREPAYLDIHMSHQDSKIGQMGAGACGVRPVGAEQAAVLRGPEAGHCSL